MGPAFRAKLMDAAGSIHAALTGYLAALAFLAVAFLGEGLFLAITADRVPWWSFWANLGALAPLVFVLAAACSVVWLAWMHRLGALSGSAPNANPLRAAVAWLSTGDADVLARRTASLMALESLAKLWVPSSMFATGLLFDSIVQPFYASLGSALVGLALIAFFAALHAPLAWLYAWPLAALAQRPRLAPFTRPIALVVFSLASVALIIVAFFILYGDTAEQMPWGLVIGPAAGAAAFLLAIGPLAGSLRRTALSAACATAVVVATGFLTLHMPTQLAAARSLLIGQPSLASKVAAAVEARTDYDKDGATAYFGGGDCAPHNPAQNPRRMEILNNGIDEDCRFGDLTADVATYKTGKNKHPRPAGIGARPNILLVTVDALSQEHTTLGGYKRNVTPNLAAWAKQATTFESAFAVSSGTRLTFPALVAGQFDATVRMVPARSIPYPLHPDTRTLASALKALGYETVHIVPHSEFDRPAWGGYWMGFDEVNATAYRNAKDSDHTSPEITEAALDVIHRERTKPLFLWIHYYDAHAPYTSPPGVPAFGKEQLDRYDAEVLYQDKAVGRVLEAARAQWAPENRAILFTSDHGEGWGPQHRRAHHGYTLDTEVLHIPLVIEGPWALGHGARIRGLASQLDVVPTLLNLAGAEPWSEVLGESLVPVLSEGREPEKTVVFSLFYLPEDRLHDKDPFRMLGVRTADYAYTADYARNAHQLVQWRTDKEERINLFAKDPDRAAIMNYLAAAKVDWLRAHEQALKQASEGATRKGKRPRARKDRAEKIPGVKKPTGVGPAILPLPAPAPR